jgi:hypothetical protein
MAGAKKNKEKKEQAAKSDGTNNSPNPVNNSTVTANKSDSPGHVLKIGAKDDSILTTPSGRQSLKRGCEPRDPGISPPLKKQPSLPDLFERQTVTASEVSYALEQQIVSVLQKPGILGALSIGISADGHDQ